MGLFGNWNKIKETEFFVGSVEEARNRYDPAWTKLSFDHIRNAVSHLLRIQKLNAVDEIQPVGWDYVANIASDLKGLYDRDGHSDPAQSCQFILDCCNRYLGRVPTSETEDSPPNAQEWTTKIECPHCGQRIEISAADIGRVAPCPTCRNEFTIPPPEPPKSASAEELATTLYELAADGVEQLVDYFIAIQPTSDERRRILLALRIFPIAVALGEADLNRSPELKEVVAEARDKYLDLFNDQDRIVRCGDYVLWWVEHDIMIRVLSENYGEVITENQFNRHQIRHGLLVRALVDSRRETFFTDIKLTLRKVPDGDPIEFIKLALQNISISFTRQVIGIDVASPTITPSDEERVATSIGLAAKALGPIYLGVQEALRALRTEPQ